jgi:hypothetical protein
LANYLILSPTWLHAAGRANIEMHQPGDVVTFAGNPGVTLFPLDDEARRARLAFIRTRNRDQRDKDELQVRRFRATLTPRPVLERFDAAAAAFERYCTAQEQGR